MTLQEVQQIEPDENGIITVEINGVEKRYLKSKMIDYLQRNPDVPLFGKRKKVAVKKVVPQKRVKKIKLAKMPDQRGIRNSIPIIAIMPDGTEVYFPSSIAAVKEFKLCRSAVSKVLTCRQEHVQNIVFKYQKTA